MDSDDWIDAEYPGVCGDVEMSERKSCIQASLNHV